jgi:drug/metabolite transporter (DMT)-like permease
LDERGTALLLVFAALVAGAAVLCQFYAYRELLVAYVETIKRAGGIFSVLIGVFGFGEGGFANRFPATVLMLIGIALILFK